MVDRSSPITLTIGSVHCVWGEKLIHVLQTTRANQTACDQQVRPGVLVTRRLADFVVHLGEGVLAAKLLPQLVVQLSIKHLPELLSVHVHVCVEHLEPTGETGGSVSDRQKGKKTQFKPVDRMAKAAMQNRLDAA